MTCSCFCHFMSNKLLSAYANCPGCAQWHTPEPLWVDHKTVRVLVLSENVTEDDVIHANRFTWRVRLDATNSLDDEYMVGALVSKGFMAADYMSATEEAYRMLAKEVNGHWQKYGQSEWARTAVLTATVQQGGSIWNNSAVAFYQKSEQVGGNTIVRDLKKWLPGLDEVVTCPATKRGLTCEFCGSLATMVCTHSGTGAPCGIRKSVREIIVHLNDGHRWDRNAVADWLESLDVDLSFGSEPPPPALPPAKRDEHLFIVAVTFQAARQEASRRQRDTRQWTYVAAHGKDATQALRGHRDQQYTLACSPGDLSYQVTEMLQITKSVEVGEEEHYAYAAVEKIKAEMEKMYEAIKAPVSEQEIKWLAELKGTTPVAVTYDEVMSKVASMYQQAQKADPWPASHSYHLTSINGGDHKTFPCKGPDCGICKLAAANEMAELQEMAKSPQQKALDAKKKNAHTAFTVNPTKKSPHKK